MQIFATKPEKPTNSFKFILPMWLCSRIIIVIAMVIIAPAISSSHRVTTWGWDTFTRWDGEWYQLIATSGYEYANDGRTHSVPFFPLYPLICRVVMAFGLPFPIAGTLVNNLAFLGTLFVVFGWVQEKYGLNIAKWTVAVMVWCPLSLYATVTYTEGLFLLLSTLSLRAFDKGNYIWAGFWGALTTATRLTGIVLIPSFLLLAWKERRPIVAYITAAITSMGLLLYMTYSAIHFGEPLVFLKAQAAFGHRSAAGFPWQRWLEHVMRGLVGSKSLNNLSVSNLLHTVQFASICTVGFLIKRNYYRINKTVVSLVGFILLVWLWLLWGDSFVKIYMVFGGAYLLWYFRVQLGSVVLTYGIFALLLVLFSGSDVACDRYAFAIVSFAQAAGMFLSKYSRWAIPVLAYSAIVLITFAIRFSRNIWVA